MHGTKKVPPWQNWETPNVPKQSNELGSHHLRESLFSLYILKKTLKNQSLDLFKNMSGFGCVFTFYFNSLTNILTDGSNWKKLHFSFLKSWSHACLTNWLQDFIKTKKGPILQDLYLLKQNQIC